MSDESEFDFSAQMFFAGGPQAQRNWDCMKDHAVAEWSGDVEATMATITRNDPFQVFYPTGLDVRGWENVRTFYAERFETFSGQGFYAHRWIVTDEVIAGQGYFKNNPKGNFFGLPSYGKPIFLPMALWIYFENGLLKGEAAYFDRKELERQIEEGATGDVRTPIY